MPLKLKMPKYFLLLTAIIITSYTVPGTAEAQTGSRIKQSASPETILWVSAPKEIGQIRRLLQDGKVDKAVRVARQFANYVISSVEGVAGVGAVHSYEYAALNALCVALSSAGKPDEAVRECDRAISRSRHGWQAYNSRGTAHYLAGRYSQALVDYRQAHKFQRRDDLRELVEHNIALAEARLAGS